ncbi:SpoVA/SpoVAEb family sporulation membrane protein [Bacillus sp. HMF5848]|uniref:SpoVA/SpoVAEb family sporulation membrane protein n=1 Tax=Bacillus sp. HMF5848 TaxID=2495421 RepID=UPI000F766783|nr:SpoVA/SpoVAEb family sporulation membrane protein [Bacillus sp. HMF5848]RSK27705.1 SpoVA/SpoVAEb family sporulation membrane protein [Bacillus sp. HMF5848]
MDVKQFHEIRKQTQPKSPYLSNNIRAFLIGGILSTVAAVANKLFVRIFSIDSYTAGLLVSVIFIILATAMTVLNLYQKFAQNAGATSVITFLGLANGLVSTSIEYKLNGGIHGSATHMIKFISHMLVFAVVTAYCVAIIKVVLLFFL